MWKLNSVEFSPKVALKDLPKKNPTQIFDAWLDRINTYYLVGAQKMDETENGFASMILQLCALDALGTLLEANKDTEKRIRSFCQIVIKENNQHSLSKEELEKASQHLYYQYRCGLVHNGFTVQVGKFAKNNEPDHIFLISYATPEAVMTNMVANQSAFIVNPVLFRENLESVIKRLKIKTSIQDKTATAKKICLSLSSEIEIARKI